MKIKLSKNLIKKNHVTNSNLFSKFYFKILHKKILNIGNFNRRISILDYGCGKGDLKKLNKKMNNVSKIINYDKVKTLSDINSYKNIKLNTVVFCQIFYLLKKKEIKKILKEFKAKDKNIDVIVAFSTQGILNKIFAFILGHKDAHYGTKTKPIEEEKILLEECNLIKKINFFGLFKILKLKFKEI